MPHLRRLLLLFLPPRRACISLFAGFTTGLFAWLLPPLPENTLRVQHPILDKAGVTRCWAWSVSSDGRYVVTGQSWSERPGVPAACETSLAVWDLQGDVSSPIIEIPNAFLVEFGSNENSILVEVGIENLPYEIWDLATRRKLAVYKSDGDHFFSSADGRLLAATDGVVTDAATRVVLHRLPPTSEGLKFDFASGEFAVYRPTDPEIHTPMPLRIHSLGTGRLHSEATLPGKRDICGLSRSGNIVAWAQFAEFNDEGTYPNGVMNLTTGERWIADELPGNRFWHLSPDGEYIAHYAQAKPIPWLDWLGIRRSGQYTRIIHWTTRKEVAAFYDGVDFVYSPMGNRVAVSHDGHVIDIYEFPFRKPWRFIISAALFGAAFSWFTEWRWALRQNRPSSVTPPAESTPARGS